MSEFRMPSLGADMEAGTLLTWRKSPGDRLAKGDTIAEVDTDKGVIDVEVFHAGVLEEILVAEGTKVPVGTPLARIREATVRHGPALADEQAARLRISPAARRLARRLGVQPAGLTGSGPSGAITRADIERAAARTTATPGPPLPAETTEPQPRPPEPRVSQPAEDSGERPTEPPAEQPATDRQDRMRRSIAAAMTRSNREIPHYHLWTTIDLARATRWLADVNAERSVEERLLPGVLLLKATALALGEHGEFSAVWRDDHVLLRQPAQLGVAISLRGGGLVVATLHDAATRSLDDLMAGLGDLTARARTGRLKSSELADSTITVTSLGDRGVEAVLGVIYPPQVALVGFGRIAERPWAIDGGLHVRPVVTASLAADHRASDGHRGGLFLAAIDRLLQEPETL